MRPNPDQAVLDPALWRLEMARRRRQLDEFKQFLIDYSKIIPEKDLQSFLNGYQNTIDSILKQATAWGASDDLLNLIYTSAPSYVKAFDRRFKQYPGRVDKLSTDALEVASTSDKPEVQEQLRSQVAQMKDLAANATNLYRQGDYLQAANVVGELEPIFNAVWKLTNYEKMSATAKLSSAKEVGPAKELGGGEFSKVYEVNYDPAKNPSIQHGVFKQEQRDYSGKDSAGASESGIPELNANFGGRSVATYKVDKLLKLGMTPKTKFGTHEGEIGTVQGWAKGKAPQKKGDDEEGP